VGGRQKPLPQKLLGRDLFWWLVTTRLFKTSIDSRLGRKLSRRDTLIGSTPRALKRAGVKLKPRTTAASGRMVSFSDGSDLSVDAVIWATGFTLDHSWIKLPIVDDDGNLRHRRGVTDIPGLYFLGLPWQHTRGSALLGWVKEDAEYIAWRMAAGARESEQQAPRATRALATGGAR
jgi:putative flavoprotein involved in K+ transport